MDSPKPEGGTSGVVGRAVVVNLKIFKFSMVFALVPIVLIPLKKGVRGFHQSSAGGVSLKDKEVARGKIPFRNGS